MGQLERRTLPWKDKWPVILTSLYKVSSPPEKATSNPNVTQALFLSTYFLKTQWPCVHASGTCWCQQSVKQHAMVCRVLCAYFLFNHISSCGKFRALESVGAYRNCVSIPCFRKKKCSQLFVANGVGERVLCVLKICRKEMPFPLGRLLQDLFPASPPLGIGVK